MEKEVRGISPGVSFDTPGKSLAVRYDKPGARSLLQGCNSFGYPVILCNNSYGARIQNIPDCLLLGENQPAFRSRFIDGNYQNNKIPGLQKIGNNGIFRFLFQEPMKQFSLSGNICFHL